ncbi:unnamed protein product [Hymenolepis diminuta]|uniref:Cytochrome b n=1 Tax=Hymenolepis diminuta TaxID=6216 RepID=A0A0R3SH12_HYMDI|nr:unnamed protein product [Hymenolepis diminuta]
MPAKDFLQLPVQHRTQLKWKLLLNRFKVYFWMRQPGFDQPNPYLNVLACERPNPFEVYSSLGAVTSELFFVSSLAIFLPLYYVFLMKRIELR